MEGQLRAERELVFNISRELGKRGMDCSVPQFAAMRRDEIPEELRVLHDLAELYVKDYC